MPDTSIPANADTAADAAPYRVLARKYRPQTFAQLIGQEALVRTLTNAIESGRIAQAYMLTGVRGVGKTTTARIIARALNCIGTDGQGGPTITPCGVCEPCVAIAADRHVDVVEMDAASRTGVDDIREIIDGVRYRPVSARYKVYIIDEVHMLTKHAFNALLKTLEEPPEHTKFVFATTEIRKVPVTVLSRCQRFDLRRVEPDVLAKHFTGIATTEGAALDDAAARMIARAADGSVRDGLSLLDQAIALSQGDAGGTVTAPLVADMLGLADRARIHDLFESVMKGEIAPALSVLDDMHRAGADPLVIAQDLLELAHDLTRRKAAAPLPAAGDEDARLTEMASKLSIPVLARAWSMMLKGVTEVAAAPDPRAALDMILIRLVYTADLPTPGDLVRRMGAQGGNGANAPVMASGGGAGPGGGGASAISTNALPAMEGGGPRLSAIAGGGMTAPRAVPMAAQPAPASEPALKLGRYEDVVALFETKREAVLAAHMRADVHLVSYQAPGEGSDQGGRIDFRPSEHAPSNLAARIGELLQSWTGRRWMVTISGSRGGETMVEQAEAKKRAIRLQVEANPFVKAILEEHFPGASIASIKALNADPMAEAAAANPTAGQDEGGYMTDDAMPDPGLDLGDFDDMSNWELVD